MVHIATTVLSKVKTIISYQEGKARERRVEKTKGHSSNCAASYNVELRQLSLFHGTISHVLRH
jgi:hypothetical protein